VLRYGWPEQWIKVLGKRINRIHVKEYSTKKMKDEGVWKGFDVRPHRRRQQLARDR